jgi:D-tyrosyl-tRNA(Tyr) deacylase
LGNHVIALLQRVSEASVLVNEKSSSGHQSDLVSGSIGHGILALVAIENGDSEAQAERLLQRILAFRMFDDEGGRMNLNLIQAGGQLLLVSQFTLAADTNCGNRPSFTPAAEPAVARKLFDYLLESARNILGEAPTGRFGEHMKVSLVNDGPVTFRLRVTPGD